MLRNGSVKNRKVDWSHWTYMPEITLWEAVALSLNIDPNKVMHSRDGWMAGSRCFDESDDFKERLQLISRYVEAGTLKPEIRSGCTADSKVALRAFIAWAQAVKWRLPDKLSTDIGSLSTRELADTKVVRKLTTRERSNMLRVIRALDVMARLPERAASTSVEKQLEKLGFSQPKQATIKALLDEARKLEVDKS